MINVTKSPVMIWIKNRIRKNKNVIIIINGATGSGKTYASLRIAEECREIFDTNFSIKENVAFNFIDLLKKTMLPINDKPGTPYVFEEVGAIGAGSSSRSWQSQANQFFFSFMQTTRHRNQILIMTCPNFAFLEKGTRSLVHLQCETSEINYSKKVCVLKPYRIQVNSRTGKFYFKYLRFIYQGMKRKLMFWEVKLPSEKILKDYEIVKLKFTTSLNKGFLDQKKEKVKEPPKNAKLNLDINKIMELKGKGYSHIKIARAFNCSETTINRRISLENSIATNKIPNI